MSILKNFVNPWESGEALGSEALGTEVLENNVLKSEKSNSHNNLSNRRGVIYYASTGSYRNNLDNAINEAKKLLRQNGISWLDFQLIDDGDESEFTVWEYPKYTIDGGIYDGAVYISVTGSYTFKTGSSMITYDADGGGTSSERDLGWKICHEIIHQYLMRLGWVFWGFEHYLQPHGTDSENKAHLNFKDDGSLYLNLMMSGHFHNKQVGNILIKKSLASLRKLVPYHEFLLKNYISLMNLEINEIAEKFERYFYIEGRIIKMEKYPYFDIRFMNQYIERKAILNEHSYNSNIYEKNYSPFQIDPKTNKEITPFFPKRLKQKIYV